MGVKEIILYVLVFIALLFHLWLNIRIVGFSGKWHCKKKCQKTAKRIVTAAIIHIAWTDHSLSVANIRCIQFEQDEKKDGILGQKQKKNRNQRIKSQKKWFKTKKMCDYICANYISGFKNTSAHLLFRI